MKKILCFIVLCFLIPDRGLGQSEVEQGAVSYSSALNVYVKFASTKNIKVNDTLFLQVEGKYQPALLVTNKSSGSCVCTRLVPSAKFLTGDVVWAKVVNKAPLVPPARKNTPNTDSLAFSPVKPLAEPDEKTIPKAKIKPTRSFRLSAGSYSTVSPERSLHRMRYSFTWQGNHIRKSKWSTDVNMAFRHTLGDWESAKNNWNNAFKIYALAAIYAIDEQQTVTLGRKINQRMTSIGAIDGLQYEYKLRKKFLLGAIAGSRPDFADYGINPRLFETGAYIAYYSNTNNRFRQSVIGFMEQRNKGVTDRRFLYAQQNADITKQINWFASAEMDVYQKVNGETSHHAQLTNLFTSMNYRVSKKLSMNVSYDNRKNVIYYEAYKSYLEQLVDFETRQGFRIGLNYRPHKMISFGGNVNQRYQKSSVATSNLNGFLLINQIPALNISAGLTCNLLKTSFIQTQSYGARVYRSFWKNKIYGEVFYRYIHYAYSTGKDDARQHVAGSSLSFVIHRNLNLYLYSEKAFDSSGSDYLMLNTRITQRF